MTQTQSGIEELLREGGAALRSGERERARALLAQAVRLNPRSEQAWLLLAGAVTDAEQRRSCLERVLRLNPEHALARKAMATMQVGGERRAASPAGMSPAADERRATSDERPAQASAAQAPSAGSLLGRLRQPEQPARELPGFEQLLAGPSPASAQPAPPPQQPAPVTPRPASPQPLSFEQLVAAPAPAAPQPAPAKPQPLSFEQLVAAAPAPAAPAAASPEPAPASPQAAAPAPAAPVVAGRASGNTELIELSAAGARRKERERRLWMAALAVGVLMMLAGLGLGLLVLLAG